MPRGTAALLPVSASSGAATPGSAPAPTTTGAAVVVGVGDGWAVAGGVGSIGGASGSSMAPLRVGEVKSRVLEASPSITMTYGWPGSRSAVNEPVSSVVVVAVGSSSPSRVISIGVFASG